MKKLLSVIIIIALLSATLTGCYFISGQKMRRVQGTYKLTNYTYTPKYERREGYTPTTYDYVNGEKYMYEDYLIVTGTGTGYYVHKEAGGDNYIKEVTLRYEYDSEDSSKVNYVIYNDSISVNQDSGIHRLGVSKNNFNYSKAAIDYTELFTKRPMRSESLSIRWEKVDRATDLSYVKDLLGDMKEYDYKSFAKRGIYELTPMELPEGAEYPTYFFVMIDTAKGACSATVYEKKNADSEATVKAVGVSNSTDDWSTFTVGELKWSFNPTGNNYIVEYDGITYTTAHVSNSVNQSAIDELIANKTAE